MVRGRAGGGLEGSAGAGWAGLRDGEVEALYGGTGLLLPRLHRQVDGRVGHKGRRGGEGVHGSKDMTVQVLTRAL